MNRNLERLIEVSRGDLIAFCEGDDCWLGRDKLQSQVDFLRQRPYCGLVHGNYSHLIRIAGVWRTRLEFRKQRQLLWLAFRAGDQSRFEQARNLFAKNCPALLLMARVRMMCSLTRWPQVCAVTLSLLYAAASIKHRIEFRRIDARGPR